MTAPDQVDIQIVSDVVCPWCYIGKRRLEQALGRRPGIAARISWLPFQLAPDLPREGRDRREHYADIFGSERADQIIAGMAERGRADGIDFRLEPGARSPNTLAAHVLMYWAGQAGVQDVLAEKLFHAHHVACEDVGDPAVLARLAGESGMHPADVLAGLSSGRDEDTVRALIHSAREAGVTGVPFFVFNRQYGISGAQPAEAFMEVLDRLAGGPGAPARELA